jgi:hypothetical protein
LLAADDPDRVPEPLVIGGVQFAFEPMEARDERRPYESSIEGEGS